MLHRYYTKILMGLLLLSFISCTSVHTPKNLSQNDPFITSLSSKFPGFSFFNIPRTNDYLGYEIVEKENPVDILGLIVNGKQRIDKPGLTIDVELKDSTSIAPGLEFFSLAGIKFDKTDIATLHLILNDISLYSLEEPKLSIPISTDLVNSFYSKKYISQLIQVGSIRYEGSSRSGTKFSGNLKFNVKVAPSIDIDVLKSQNATISIKSPAYIGYVTKNLPSTTYKNFIFSNTMNGSGTELPQGKGRVDGGIKQKPEWWYNKTHLWRIGPWVTVNFEVLDTNNLNFLELKLQQIGSGGEQERTIADILINDQIVPSYDGFTCPIENVENFYSYEIPASLVKKGKNIITLRLTPNHDKFVWWIKSIEINSNYLLK